MKALKKIINFGVDNILYISCKPTSLARDLEMLTACGYKSVRICALDQFPGTVHVEAVCLLEQQKRAKDFIEIGIDAEEYYRIKDSETAADEK